MMEPRCIIDIITLPINRDSIRFIGSPASRNSIFHIQLRDSKGVYQKLCNILLKHTHVADSKKIRYANLCRACTFLRYRSITDNSLIDLNRIIDFYNNIRSHHRIRNYSLAKGREYEETGNIMRYLNCSNVDAKYFRSTGRSNRDYTSEERETANIDLLLSSK